MKNSSLWKLSVWPVTLIGIVSMLTQTASSQPASAIKLEPPREASLNRFGLSFGMTFNATVDFKHFGAFTPPGASRQTPDGDAFNYDDGYVLTDSTGNQLGFTRYWGYDSSSQVPGDGSLLMHRSSSMGTTAKDREDDPQAGFELSYQRELGRGKKFRWGLEAAFGFMNIDVQDSQPLSFGVSRLTDTYALGTVVPPPAPYYHGANLSPEGNPVIGATPTGSNLGSVPATVNGPRNFDANLFELRLGPYLEVPLGRKLALSFSGGLALVEVSSDFSFKETISVPGVAPVSGSGSHSDLQVGGYAAGNLAYKLSEAWGLFSGVQFQDVGKYTHRENGRAAVLNLGQTINVVIGASYSF
jgi:hypothetical protein